MLVNPIIVIYPSLLFLFIKAGNPLAIRQCSFDENGEIKLQNVTMGNCNQNLETLEKQVGYMFHEMVNGKKVQTVHTLCSSDT